MSFLVPANASVLARASASFSTNSRDIRIFMAASLLRCWLRSPWDCTTSPVGRCVMRTADSVLFTCWPPAPPARMVSMRRSSGPISTLMVLSTIGRTITDENEVWRRALAS